MSIQIFPESVETFECTICYESYVELIPVCNNKHNICKNCVNRLKNKKCPFCRTDIDYDVDVESQEEQREQRESTNIERVVPEYLQNQTNSCDCISQFTLFLSIVTLIIVFVMNYDTFTQSVKIMFVVLILLLLLYFSVQCSSRRQIIIR